MNKMILGISIGLWALIMTLDNISVDKKVYHTLMFLLILLMNVVANGRTGAK